MVKQSLLNYQKEKSHINLHQEFIWDQHQLLLDLGGEMIPMMVDIEEKFIDQDQGLDQDPFQGEKEDGTQDLDHTQEIKDVRYYKINL